MLAPRPSNDNKHPNGISLSVKLLPALLILLVDQASKNWILHGINLPMRGKIEISALFDLTMVWNRGVSFGLFYATHAWAKWALVAMVCTIVAVFFYQLLKTQSKLLVLALSMVIGGAIGNMIDRVRYGAVVDFLDFSGAYFPWVFNVADAAISIGFVLFVLANFSQSPAKAAAAADDARSDGGAGAQD